MNQLASRMPTLRVALALVSLTTPAWAQDSAQPAEVKRMCPAVLATVMVGKVACSAALCNMGTAQGGWLGLVTQVALRGNSIDAGSFSAGFSSQLATAMRQTGCFTVVDATSLEESRKEMEALGRAPPPAPNVDFVVRTDITKADLVVEETGVLVYKSRTAKSTLGVDTKLVSAASGAVSSAGAYEAVTEKKSTGVDLGPLYRSGDDAGRRPTPFADVAREVIVKATVGLTNQILAQPAATRPAPTVAQAEPTIPVAPSAASAASAPL